MFSLLQPALMLGTAGLPHVIVRFFTVPKVRDARMSAGYALLFIAISLYNCARRGSFRPCKYDRHSTWEELMKNVADWVPKWRDAGLITMEDKNGDGIIQYYNDKNPAFAATAEANGWERQ